MKVNRRQFLALNAAVPLATRLGAWPMAAANRRIAGYNPDWLPDAQQLQRWLRQLHDFGPVRATGTRQARTFEEWLAKQVTALGFTLERDRYRLTSWEADVGRDCSIAVAEDGGIKKTVEVVAYYPFSRSTRGSAPVVGRVLYVPTASSSKPPRPSSRELIPPLSPRPSSSSTCRCPRRRDRTRHA